MRGGAGEHASGYSACMSALAFFRALGQGRFEATEHGRGPWSNDHLHAGPPSALMARVARETGAPYPLRRMSVELRAPVPLGELRVDAAVEKTGRQVERVRVSLFAAEREVASGLALKTREEALGELPERASAPTPFAGPDDAAPFVFPFFRHEVGYHQAMDLRLAEGTWGEGPVTAWMRMRGVLVEDEPAHPLDHLFAAADSGNGLSPVLDPFEHTFLNADLSVHVQGEPIDGWVGMQARTWIDARGAGVAHSALWSTEGPLGHALQSLVVRRAR